MIGELRFMDLLFSKYASPMDCIAFHINRGRFGEFVSDLVDRENERIMREAEKDEEWKLWTLFLHSSSGESFAEWKKKVLKKTEKKRSRDEDLDDDGINAIINKVFNQ